MAHLSDEIKYYIKFMHKFMNLSPKEIKDHPALLKKDGSKYRLSIINFWLKRIKTTGSISKIKRNGPKKSYHLKMN